MRWSSTRWADEVGLINVFCTNIDTLRKSDIGCRLRLRRDEGLVKSAGEDMVYVSRRHVQEEYCIS